MEKLNKQKIIKNIECKVKDVHFVHQILKCLGNDDDSQIKIYPYKDFKKIDWQDFMLYRVVARNKDILFCVELNKTYTKEKIKKDIIRLGSIIKKVVKDGELDRIVYIRLFLNAADLSDSVIVSKGYVDENREFNEDILDIIDVSLNKLYNQLECNELATILKKIVN